MANLSRIVWLCRCINGSADAITEEMRKEDTHWGRVQANSDALTANTKELRELLKGAKRES